MCRVVYSSIEGERLSRVAAECRACQRNLHSIGTKEIAHLAADPLFHAALLLFQVDLLTLAEDVARYVDACPKPKTHKEPTS